MNQVETRELDLIIRAENGLRRGWTTGSCAAAGVKAAIMFLEDGEMCDQVPITLPDRQHFLVLPVTDVKRLDDGSVCASVVKDAGDDPDNTRGATIVSTVRRNHLGQIRFFAGKGVGIVTEPGIRVPLGEPAINPAPRQMMVDAIDEILAGRTNPGYDLTIGCENGEAIARRTFNPRLGIVGGISILGTTGIVEPMSLAAYKASIEVYIRVAVGGVAHSIALMPGNIGLGFAKNKLGLQTKRIVQIANFVGFALASTETALAEDNAELGVLWVLGHPGKLAKVLDNVWDTHSANSGMAMQAVARVAQEIGCDSCQVQEIEKANSIEAVIKLTSDQSIGTKLWITTEHRLAKLMHQRVPRASQLFVRLFSMNGAPLGEC